jgi:SAM-dependent methyltransferase
MLIILPNVQHRDVDFELDAELMRRLWRMEERHFWHAARNRWIRRALEAYGLRPPARILDVGCGSGAVSGMLHRQGYSVVGVDTGEMLVRKADERFPEATFVAGEIERLTPDLGPFDAIGFFDVLEHLDQPGAFMDLALAHARPGALVMATVPALMELYSTIDRLSGHKRRYEPGELKRLFVERDLVDVKEHGIFRVMRALLRLRRKPNSGASGPATGPDDASIDSAARRKILMDDTRIPAFPLNGLLNLACAVEERIGFGRSQDKAGPTFLVVGRTPGPVSAEPQPR